MVIFSRFARNVFIIVLCCFIKYNAFSQKASGTELYVKWANASTAQEINQHGAQHQFFVGNGTLKCPTPQSLVCSFSFSKNSELLNISRLRYTHPDSAKKALDILNGDDNVAYAEFVPRLQRFLTPNDLGPNTTSSGGQWYHYKIQSQQAWDVQTASSSVRVAVVDDAIQTQHPELQGACLSGYDAAELDFDVEPPTAQHDHGTHVAGLIAALTDNGQGMASLAYGVRILPVKVTFDSNPDAVASGFEGIAWAVTNNADVINCSWGSDQFSQTGLTVIQDALNANIVVVAAAGNNNNSVLQFPAAYPGVIAVAATAQSDNRASFSTYGEWIDIAAPGSQIWSLAPNGGYQIKNGTSFSAPLVSALAALLKSYNQSLSPAEIEACIKESSTNIQFLNPGFENLLGAGRINAFQAVQCVRQSQLSYNISLGPILDFPALACAGGFQPKIWVKNSGISSLQSLTLRLQLDSEVPFFQTYNGLLESGDSTLITFPTLAVAPGVHQLSVQLYGLLNGLQTDAYLPDNQRLRQLTIYAGAGRPLPFSEDFQSGQWSDNDWLVSNPDDDLSWEIVSVFTPQANNRAAVLHYFVNDAMNSRDAFVSPPLDLSGVSAATLEFDFAYKQRDMGLSDSLILYYSLDCGQTFSKLRYWHGMGSLGLSTAPAFPDNFVPQAASEWCGVLQASAPCAQIDLNELLGNHSVVFKWEGVCKNGNNIYVDNINITGTEIQDAPQASFLADWDLPACVGSAVQFQSTSSGSIGAYSWTFEGGSPSTSNVQHPQVSFFEAGTYAVQLIVSNTWGADTVNGEVTVIALPSTLISASSDTLCSGNTAVLTATGAETYFWNSGPGMSTTLGSVVEVSPANTATYIVNGVSLEGCLDTARQKITVISQPPQPSITVSGANLVASPGTAYQWYINGNLIPTATSQVFQPLENGNYNVRVYVEDSCSAISSVFPVNFVGMQQIEALQGLRIYPNPSGGAVQFSWNQGAFSRIRIYSADGKLVLDMDATHTENFTMPEGVMTQGLYSICAEGGNFVSTQRLLVN
ncbi:MAG: S8 family serine peptidase [Bacteroidia bacterium]